MMDFSVQRLTNVGMIFVFAVICAGLTITLGKDLTLEPGHLKPFGEGRPTHPVEESIGFLSPKDFFENHFKPLRPLKMKGAAAFSPAFKKWTDEYFLKLEEPSDHFITMETVKKEYRQQKILSMHFVDFVRTYNSTENYMVSEVPFFLSQDVVMPCSLQCRTVLDKHLVDIAMWFSSGGTKSLVHTDGADNINCLMRGEKTLIMVDPALYGGKVDFDRPEQSYSSMDVDSVDYLKFPGMADVEFYHVNVSAGDCVYIPYKWIHQAQSYGSNLAVNVWWKHYISDDLNYEECNDPCDPTLTLKNVHFFGYGGEIVPDEIRDQLLSVIRDTGKEMRFEVFASKMFGDQMLKEMMENPDVKLIFKVLDVDKDGIITRQEIQSLPNTVYTHVGTLIVQIEEEMEEEDDGKEIYIYEEDSGVEGAGNKGLDDSDVMDPDVRDEL